MFFTHEEKVVLLAMQKAGLTTPRILMTFRKVRWSSGLDNEKPSLISLDQGIRELFSTHALLSNGWVLDYSQWNVYVESSDGYRLCIQTDTLPEGAAMHEILNILKNKKNK